MTSVPADWVTGPLGKFAPLQRGFDLPTSKVVPGSVPVVYSNGIGRYHNKAMVNGPGVVTGRSGTIGRVHFVDRPYWPHNTALWVTDFSQCTPKFAYYLLQSVGLERFAGGSGVPTLNRNDAHSFEIYIPASRSEQTRVANALSDTDDLIATLESLITKKQAIKQGMMQQLLTGRTRLPGFNGRSWQWKPFSEVMSRINAKKHQIQASEYSDIGSLPVVDQGKKPIIGYTNDLDARFAPSKDGVIVFGDHTCITKFVDFNFAVGADGTQLVRAKAGSSTRFFAYALEVDPVVSTGYNRHFKLLREKMLPVPERAEQDTIVEVLANTDRELDTLRNRLVKTRAVKTGMMQQLLTGRTRLPIEEAA